MMEIILGFFSIIFMGIIVGIPLRLIFRKWNDSTVAYLTAAILTGIAILIAGFPSLPIFILRLVAGALIVGSVYWGIIALLRKAFKKPFPVKRSEVTNDYLICPECGLEQWQGYNVCQKCGFQLHKTD